MTNIIYTYISTIMDDFDLLEINILRVTPQHGQDKIINRGDWLVLVLKKHVQEILFGKKGGSSDFEGA